MITKPDFTETLRELRIALKKLRNASADLSVAAESLKVGSVEYRAIEAVYDENRKSIVAISAIIDSMVKE